MKRVLYVIPHRARTYERQRNLEYCLQWLAKIKTSCAEKCVFDILVVEQDEECRFTPPAGVNHLFLKNKGIFNKCWAFNVAHLQFENYDYYAFGDNDIIVPDIEDFVTHLIKHCEESPKKVYQPYRELYQSLQADLQNCESYEEFSQRLSTGDVKTTACWSGLNLAGGLVVIAKDTLNQVNGWDEDFEGWGRHDDFMTHKLEKFLKCDPIRAPSLAVHLWHPIQPDFKLNQSAVDLFDKLLQFTNDEMQNYIDEKRGLIGNVKKYENNQQSTINTL